jgi:hypothetical protein
MSLRRELRENQDLDDLTLPVKLLLQTDVSAFFLTFLFFLATLEILKSFSKNKETFP